MAQTNLPLHVPMEMSANSARTTIRFMIMRQKNNLKC